VPARVDDESSQQCEARAEHREDPHRLDAAFSALPADRFPNIARDGDVLTSGSGDERFTFAVDVFLDGLEARAARA
jgi:tetracycline repressor-like protein